ncbi:MAG: hypothetical protein HRU34_24510 [Richelia sp.]|nr:hypothetical protein [Richelia sp.]
MKFSVTSSYPISTSARATNYEQSWELAIAGVEYLFVDISSHDGKLRGDRGNAGNINENIQFNLFDAASRIKQSISGRYRLKNPVPI